MRFTSLQVEDFRNFTRMGLAFGDGSQFICGENGHGKTNLLEALSLVTYLRSFRVSDIRPMLRVGTATGGARLLYQFSHEQFGETELEIQLSRGSKRLLLDGNPLRRLKDMIGLFPTVPLTSNDIQLLRGGPTLRRRWLDMMLVELHPPYYDCLINYHQALKSRNALLKQRANATARRPFETLLLEQGWQLQQMRTTLLEQFQPHFAHCYQCISGVAEQPEVVYAPNLVVADREDFERKFHDSKRRDEESGSTQRGPHRDDLELRLFGQAARDFASEGQQRGLVLALRLGMVEWLRAKSNVTPVILADDVVGELDAQRRLGFWHLVGGRCQVIATGTQFPAATDEIAWHFWHMRNGCVTKEERSQP